jgi:hypothetical protein
MENNMSANGGNKVVLISLLAVIFIVGFAAGAFYYKKIKMKASSTTSLADQDKACWEQAKQRLKDAGFISNTTSQAEVKSIVGNITAIDNNLITLKTVPLEPLTDPALDVRIIAISNDTKIYQMEKVAGTAGKATKSGTNQSANQKINYHFENKEITLDSLKIGDKISVYSGTNIKDQKNIQAISVYLLPVDMPKN